MLTSETFKPTADSPLPPSEVLQLAREELLSTFKDEFAKASHSKDAATASRFFKLFPLIGWEVEGLETYATFVVDLVRNRPSVSLKGLHCLLAEFFVHIVSSFIANVLRYHYDSPFGTCRSYHRPSSTCC
jgi:hypothetical protein